MQRPLAPAHRPFSVATLLFVLSTLSCGLEEAPIDDPTWLPQAMGRAVGETIAVKHDDEDARHVLHALGYRRLQGGRYERQTDLWTHDALVPSVMPELPDIDAIAIISIYRAGLGEQQYIYATLRSLLAELPQQAQINVLVGHDDSAYLSPSRLAQEIGADAVARVHVTAASADIRRFFEEEDLKVSMRATWNYARALRAYQGSSHLMLLEDDISLAKNSLKALQPYLAAGPVDVLTLFNNRCNDIETTHALPNSKLTLAAKPVRGRGDFTTTQAMIFHAEVAQAAGQFLATRAGREPYDFLLGRYCAQSGRSLGFVQPSIVQHEGLKTTGLSSPITLPISGCAITQVD